MRVTLVILLAAIMTGAGTAQAESPKATIDSLDWRLEAHDNSAMVRSFQRVTIFSPAGDDYAAISIEESDFESIDAVEIRMLDSSGKVIQRIGKKDMTRACGFGADYSLYADNCTYLYRLASAKYPFTVECLATIKWSSLFWIPGPELSYDVPLLRANVVVDFENRYPLAWKMYGLDIQPLQIADEKHTTLTWLINDQPAKVKKIYVPSEFLDRPRLQLAAEKFELGGFSFNNRSWKSYGHFYNQLAAGRYFADTPSAVPPPATRATVDSIYTDVITSTRYVSVNIDIGGWQPERAETVRKMGYGDCKGLSTLLIAQLRRASIRAYPVLVKTDDNGAIDPSFPVDNFNHVIACAILESDTIWMDPTCSSCPLGDLPAGDEGTLALLVVDTGGVVVQLPWSRSEDNEVVRTHRITLDDPERVTAVVSATISGNYAASFRSYVPHASIDERNDMIREWLIGKDNRFVVSKCAYAGPTDLAQPVSLEAQLTAAKPLERIRQTRYLTPYLVTNRDAFSGIRFAERDIPIDFGYPWRTRDSIVVTGAFLGTLDSVVMPPSDSVSFDGGWVVVSWENAGGDLIGCLREEYTRTRVEVADFAELEKFITARKKLLDRPIKFFAKTGS